MSEKEIKKAANKTFKEIERVAKNFNYDMRFIGTFLIIFIDIYADMMNVSYEETIEILKKAKEMKNKGENNE